MAASPHLARLLDRAESSLTPIDVSIAVTERCNFRCRHCYLPDLTASDRLTTGRLLGLLEELAAIGCLFLTFTGGEPLLRPDLIELALHARRLGFRVRLFTNGSLVDAELAGEFARLDVAVEIGLHSLRESSFSEHVGRAGALARTVRGVKLLRSRGVDVTIKTVVGAANAPELSELSAFAKRMGARYLADRRIVHRRNGDRAPAALRLPLDAAASLCRESAAGLTVPEVGAPPPVSGRPLCAAGVRSAHVTAAGDVLACTVLPVRAGNVVAGTFREVWEQSEWLRKLRSISRQDLRGCGTCPKLGYCGRCHAQALVEDGDVLGPSSWACENAAVVERAWEAAE